MKKNFVFLCLSLFLTLIHAEPVQYKVFLSIKDGATKKLLSNAICFIDQELDERPFQSVWSCDFQDNHGLKATVIKANHIGYEKAYGVPYVKYTLSPDTDLGHFLLKHTGIPLEFIAGLVHLKHIFLNSEAKITHKATLVNIQTGHPIFLDFTFLQYMDEYSFTR